MPILHVRALPQKDSRCIQEALKRTCHAIACIYGCKPDQVWATWEDIKIYVEGTTFAETQPADSHPPIAQLIAFEGKTPSEIENVLSVAAKTLTEELGISGNIFMTYHEAKSGQVIAGDGIIRKT